MYCKKCGKQISDDSLFCEYCGAALQEADDGAVATGPSEQETPPAQALSSEDGFLTAPPVGGGSTQRGPAPGVPAAGASRLSANRVPAPAEDVLQSAPEVTGDAAPGQEEAADAATEISVDELVAEGFEPAGETPAEDGFQSAPGMTESAMPAEDGFQSAPGMAEGAMPAEDGFQSAPGMTESAMPAEDGFQSAPYTVPMDAYAARETAAPKKKGGAKKIVLPIVIIAGVLVLAAVLWGALGGGQGSGSNVPESEYKANCAVVSYDDLNSKLSTFKGDDIEFQGEIFEVHEEGNEVICVMDTAYDEEYAMYLGDTLIIKYDPEGISTEPDEWDLVTVYGVVEDKEEFDSEYGDYTAPVIRAKYIDIDKDW